MQNRLPRTAVEMETKRRINLALWAYAYEFKNTSLVSDAVFDIECMMVNLNLNTNRPDLDNWFRKNFTPCTGMWIRNHPELDKISELYEKHYTKRFES